MGHTIGGRDVHSYALDKVEKMEMVVFHLVPKLHPSAADCVCSRRVLGLLDRPATIPFLSKMVCAWPWVDRRNWVTGTPQILADNAQGGPFFICGLRALNPRALPDLLRRIIYESGNRSCAKLSNCQIKQVCCFWHDGMTHPSDELNAS